MHRPTRGRKAARIEVIPLIDIVFFLLATIIMVTLGMTKNLGANVALPGADSAESLGDAAAMAQAVTLSIHPSGELYFNKSPMARADLPARLGEYMRTSSDPRVIIHSDGRAEFKDIVAVLDEVRLIGIDRVGISTTKE
jgi:biopolymer transport protein ExbD